MRLFYCFGRSIAFVLLAAICLVSGVSGASTDSSNDQKLLTQLGLMRGHLRMASELTDAGRAKEASLHYHHPLKELYQDIEPELVARGIPDLGAKLKALEVADEAGSDVKAPLAAVLLTIDLAEASITASPKLMLAAVVGMLRHASEEYSAAYTPAGALDKIEEYQDSRGFTRKAAEIFNRIRVNLAKRDPAPIRDIAKDIAQLQAAWPSLEGPDKPVIDAARVKALVDGIEQIAAGYRG
jgi:hypothetical protein